MKRILDNSDVALSESKGIARRAIAGEIPLLLACRDIEYLIRGSKVVSHDVLTTFTAISSECDGVPLGDERQYWEASALAQQDRRIE